MSGQLPKKAPKKVLLASRNPTPPEHQDAVVLRLAGLRKAAIVTAVVGVTHAVLFILAFFILAHAPGAKAPDQEIIDYYSDPASRRWSLLAGLYLMPFAGIAFIWFTVALRAWARGYIRRQNELLSNVQLVSGIIYTTLFFAAAAAASVTAASAEFEDTIDPNLSRLFPQYGANLLLVFSMRMASMFVLTTTNILRTTRAMPKWFAWIGYAVAIFLLLSASFNPYLMLVLPVWLLVLCIVIINRVRRIPRDNSLVAIEAEGIVLIPDSDTVSM